MILNALGVVLSRRNLGEADRLATLYTENLGKLSVRFVGVNKPARKLKALSEPMVWGEYRLHISPRSEAAKAIGGAIIASFPGIREDLGRTVEALSCLELLSHLTPERSPNAGKYRLVTSVLAALDGVSSPWLEIAYGLRLLELSGYGIRAAAVAAEDRAVWEALHSAPLGELGGIPWHEETAGRFRGALYSHAEAQAARPLKSRAFREKLPSAPKAPAC